MAAVPHPTWIFRFFHVENLPTVLTRHGIHASNCIPDDGLPYRPTHSSEVHGKRAAVRIPCGPGGSVHDYVPFYFGPLSPMMLNLKTGRVPGYNEGQEPFIYVVSTAQAVSESGAGFAFSDGHGLAGVTEWADDLARLDMVDWDMVYQRYWSDNVSDMDRQRRKQAEFLVRDFCDWGVINEVAVINPKMERQVIQIMADFHPRTHRPVRVRRDWYYH
jgi:ssDNA thymidine ADP-ribosyltransferase, DarT